MTLILFFSRLKTLIQLKSVKTLMKCFNVTTVTMTMCLGCLTKLFISDRVSNPNIFRNFQDYVMPFLRNVTAST